MPAQNKTDQEAEVRIRPGEVWVEDGRVFVRNPSGPGVQAPTITPCPGIELFVNEKKVEQRTVLKEEDDIVLKPCVQEQLGAYKIRLSSGGLTAVLELKAGTRSRFFIQDGGPECDLVLSATKIDEKVCPFTLVELMQELAQKNIIYGVKHSEIQAVLANPEDGLYVIAEGDPPGKSVDERVEICFDTGSGARPEISAGDGDRVDYRDILEIPSVEPGALLAVKHSCIQGVPGRKVTGDTIPPLRPLAVELTGGQGVELAPDGKRAIARIAGRPVLKKTGTRYFIDVDPVLHKKGDVDISNGNIRFKGDVVIHGNVCEGMTVQAAGKVNILGMVYDARIAAQSNISAAQNITGSTLVAGSNSSFFKALYKSLDTLHADLSEIAGILPSLAAHPKLKDVKAGQLVRLLIDKKFSRIPGLIGELVKLAGENAFMLPREMAVLLDKIEKNLCGLNLLKLTTAETVVSLLTEMKEVKNLMNSMAGNRADVLVGYAVNSKIEASGDVKVRGRGCINTVIRAGGNVGINGVFRGGEITASGDVVLHEAGSELGARTLIKTGHRGKVYIKKAYEGIRIQIGDRMATLTSAQNNIKAELDELGALVITRF